MMRYDLVMRKQTGKLAVSPEKQLHIENLLLSISAF